jgi:hypothetical protein
MIKYVPEHVQKPPRLSATKLTTWGVANEAGLQSFALTGSGS